jgi:hypothetical protein
VFKNRVYDILKTWVWTEKVDGTNIRVIWDPCWIPQPTPTTEVEVLREHIDQAYADPEAVYPSHSDLTFGGKTNAAQIPADLYTFLSRNVLVEKLRGIFPETRAVIYGEGYGPGIQKGGGDYRADKGLILFDVLVGDKWWLSYENVADIASQLSLPVVPLIGEMSLEEATEMVRVGFKSRCAINPEKMAEGLVGRPVETLFDKKGHRLITKLKTKDF